MGDRPTGKVTVFQCCTLTEKRNHTFTLKSCEQAGLLARDRGLDDNIPLERS